MSKELLNGLNEQIAIDKETIDVLPKNGIKPLKTLISTIDKTRKKYDELNNIMLQEIEARYEQLIKVEENSRIREIDNAISNVNDMIFMMDNRSSFGKMDLDKLIYNVNGFYKKNLEIINKEIIEGIKRFEAVGINLTAEDFNISEYAHEYMKVLIEETRNGQINSSAVKEKFEKLYWQCSDMISHIYVNLRYIYEQREKEIEKFFESKKETIEATKNVTLKQLEERRNSLLNEKRKLENIDDKLILNAFFNKLLSVGDYKKDTYKKNYMDLISRNIEEVSMDEKVILDDNVEKLYNNLVEYSRYMKFKFLNDEVLKIRLAEIKKAEANTDKKKKKSEYEELVEQIKKATDQIFKLNQKIESASTAKKGFFKKVISERDKKVTILERNKAILEVKALYIKSDEARIRAEIMEKISETSTLLDVFKFASYDYGFLAKAIIKQNSEITDSEIAETINEIRELLRSWDFAVINNVSISETKEIAIIIKDKYKLFGMNLSKENFNEGGIEDLMKKAKIVQDYNNLQKSSLTVERLDYVLQAKEKLKK